MKKELPAALMLAAFVAIMVLIIGACAERALDISRGQKLPTCEEDEVYLEGYGNFDGQHWAHYRCVHPDSLK